MLKLSCQCRHEVADRAYDGLFRTGLTALRFRTVAKFAVGAAHRMFLLYQPSDAKGINFLRFCQREGF